MMVCESMGVRFFAALFLTITALSGVRAEVFERLPLTPLQALMTELNARAQAAPNILVTNGRAVRMTRWLTPSPPDQTALYLSQQRTRMYAGYLPFPTTAPTGIQDIMVRDDGATTFQISADQGDPKAGGAAYRTVQVQPVPEGSQIIVNDVAASSVGIPSSFQGHEEAWKKHSLDGRMPISYTVKRAEREFRYVFIFSTLTTKADGIKRRLEKLKEVGYNLIAVNRSSQGAMLQAVRGMSKVSVFAYMEEGGEYVEVIHSSSEPVSN